MSVSEIITDGGRRRHWGATEKLRIVEETLDGRDSISVVARRNGVAPNLLYRWRRLMLEGGSVAIAGDDDVTSNRQVREMDNRIRNWNASSAARRWRSRSSRKRWSARARGVILYPGLITYLFALWVYPAVTASPATSRIRRTDRIDAALLDHLAGGGDALIGLPGKSVANYAKRSVQLGFSSIFWNTLWTQGQPPTTLGILCDPDHAALADFPTDAHSNWHWWHLIHRAGALRLDLLPPGVKPIVRVIDDWFTARPLGLVIEVAVGRGRAIVCGFALDGAGADDPVSRQLVASLERYMTGDRFKPAAAVSPDQLRRLAAV